MNRSTQLIETDPQESRTENLERCIAELERLAARPGAPYADELRAVRARLEDRLERGVE